MSCDPIWEIQLGGVIVADRQPPKSGGLPGMTVTSAISADDVGAMHIERRGSWVWMGLMVNPEIFRRLAARFRRLMFLVRTDAARDQLRIWAEEFEQKADELEKESRRERCPR